jgi:hypothetical protein
MEALGACSLGQNMGPTRAKEFLGSAAQPSVSGWNSSLKLGFKAKLLIYGKVGGR